MNLLILKFSFWTYNKKILYMNMCVRVYIYLFNNISTLYKLFDNKMWYS